MKHLKLYESHNLLDKIKDSYLSDKIKDIYDIIDFGYDFTDDVNSIITVSVISNRPSGSVTVFTVGDGDISPGFWFRDQRIDSKVTLNIVGNFIDFLNSLEVRIDIIIDRKYKLSISDVEEFNGKSSEFIFWLENRFKVLDIVEVPYNQVNKDLVSGYQIYLSMG